MNLSLNISYINYKLYFAGINQPRFKISRFFNFSYNHVSAKTLTTGRIIPSGTNSPPAEVLAQWW